MNHMLAVVPAILIVCGCMEPDRDPEPDALGFDFQQGLAGWEREADVPLDPNADDPTARVEWDIDIVESDRDPSVRFVLDGSQDDGTIWIERDVSPGPGTYDVEVRIDVWSASESFNTLAYLVSHLGLDDPENEEDFPEPGQNSARDDLGPGGLRETLNQAEGWKTYSFNWTTPQLSGDEVLWFAVGISVVWETEVSYLVDNAELHFTPAA